VSATSSAVKTLLQARRRTHSKPQMMQAQSVEITQPGPRQLNLQEGTLRQDCYAHASTMPNLKV
jgi:hypothetical protein